MISSRYLPCVITATLGVLASIGAFVLSMSWQHRVDSLEFDNRARDQLAVINSNLQDAGSLLETVRDLLESTDRPVTREEFSRFAQRVHRRADGLRNVGWAPRVTAADREGFERQTRATGLDNFKLLEREPSGELIEARIRSEYYPIFYMEGRGENRPPYGYDLASEPLRREAIDHAVQFGRAAATPPLRLIAAPQPRSGVMSFIPVYRGRQEASGAAHPPDGLVLGVFEISPMIDSVIGKPNRLSGMDVYLFDPNAPADDRLIYWRPDPGHPRPVPTEASVRRRPHWEGSVTILDQKWGALFSPADTKNAIWTWQAVLPAGAGLLITAMVVFYLVSSNRRTSELLKLTGELRETTKGLHETAEKVAHMACHDVLTGLPNRRLFSERLQDATDAVACGQIDVAVLLIDLDRFKPINDMHGHAAGDVVLCEVANRLRAISRVSDTVARLGGDEFAAIVAYENAVDGAGKYAARMLRALSQPIAVEGAMVEIGASIGIAICPLDGSEPECLLRAADLAMYRAKRLGRATYCYSEQRTDAELQDCTVLETSPQHQAVV